MYRPLKITAALLIALGLPQLACRAGTFTANFNDGATPTGMTLSDPAKIVATGGVNNSGYLSVNDAVGNLNGSALIDDLDASAPIGGFTATMKIRIADGNAQPADGFSFSFGPDVQASGGGEEGSGSGLRVVLDTYDNSGGEAPALDVAWGGTIFAHTKWAGITTLTDPPVIDPATGQPASLQTGGQWVDLKIDLHPNGTLDVAYKGIVVYTNLIIPGYTPTSGSFVLSARTGGSFETHWVDDLSITTVPPITGVPTIITQPADASAPERGSASFSVLPNGAPPFTFQWFTNGVAVQDATAASLTLSALTMDLNNLKVKVNIANGEGNIDSREAILTVVPDTLKPTIVKAQSSDTFTEVSVLFSEDVDPISAANKDNYTISGGVTVTDVTLIGSSAVKLTTSTQAQGAAYTLTVNNVKDIAATPNSIAANSTANFSSFSYQTGGLRMDIFLLPELAGATDVASLLASDKYINNAPDLTYYVPQFSSRSVYGGGTIDQYGGRLAGWIKPTETADYNFFLRSDDLSQLYLSPDENPANKVLIAEVTTCCVAFHEPNVDNPPPDTSAPMTLEKDKRYYVEAVWKEGGGGDYADVAWRKVGDTFAAQALPYIPGSVLETLAPPNSLIPPTITFTAPANNSSIDDTNQPVTLTVTASAAPGKTITKVEFYEQNTLLGQTNAAPYSITLTNLAEGAHKFFARAYDSAGLTTDTPVVNFSLGGLRKVVTLLAIDANTTWKYDRSGEDLGTAWRDATFDDAAWPSGKALIADETTTTVEPIRTPITRFNDAGVYVKTFFFRSHFNFAGAVTPGVKLTLRHVVDDGVVIYLNGHEINRMGITDDPVTYLSDAAGHENAYAGPFDIPTTWLQSGDNIVAAEVHQSGGSSSDMVFGLELVATIPAVTQTLFAIDNVTTWKYDRSGDDLGTGWREPAFDDALWPSGKALIADETTTTVEPIRTPITRFNDAGVYVKTFYFRTHFNFPGEIPGAILKLRHAVDDGAVFYLNGHEVSRFGVTDDPVTYLSDAAGHENAYVGPVDVSTQWLNTGDNVFAAEVHQSGGSSSDMVFGAELTGTFFPAGNVTPPPTEPKITVTSSATDLTISWTNGGKLQSADAVGGPYTTITPDASNPYVINGPTGTKFFRVLK
jgi:hypothetical protein